MIYRLYLWLQVNLLLPICFLLVMLFLVVFPLFHNASECLIALAIIATGLPVYLVLIKYNNRSWSLHKLIGE